MRAETVMEPESVIKFGRPEDIRVEAEKTRRAHLIGEKCELFRVPRVLDTDLSQGRLILEKIADIRPFREAFSFDRIYCSAARILGESLCVIHRQLTLPQDMSTPLPPELDGPGRKVFLHGDLSVYNVCAGRSIPPVVILDWQMTKVHGGKASYGSPYFDLIWFINNLFYRPRLSHFKQEEILLVAEAFLEGYGNFQRKELGDYAERFFCYKLPFRRNNATWRERFLLPLSHRLVRTFISRLSE